MLLGPQPDIVCVLPVQDGTVHSGWALGQLELLDKTPGMKTTGYLNSWITQATGPGTVYESYTCKVTEGRGRRVLWGCY